MDDSPIQTALCVIGHPIGGNPTQFVALRALSALGLDWQFISFDVDPTQIKSAIGGIDSLGFCGAMIATPYQNQVANLLSIGRGEGAETAETADWYDCLHRNADHRLVATNVLAAALQSVIQSHVESAGQSPDCCLLIGDEARILTEVPPFLPVLPERRQVVNASRLVPWFGLIPPLVFEPTPVASTLLEEPARAGDDIELAPALVIWSVDGKPGKKNAVKAAPHAPDRSFVADLLTRLHPASLLVDLSGTSSAWLVSRAEAGESTVAVVDKVELEVMRLAIAIQHWTGRAPDIDLMREAIEEYLEI